MDGGKKRCGVTDTQEKTIINQIMLKFRPIAPKPSNPDGTVSGNSTSDQKNQFVNKKRVKRKYVRVKKKKSSSSSSNCLLNKDNDDGGWLDGKVAMLQLLPETTNEVTDDGKDFPIIDPIDNDKLPFSWIDLSGDIDEGGAISLDRPPIESDLLHDSDSHRILPPTKKEVVESRITMESVTGTCEDGMSLGCTDDEKMKNLDVDTCPGFITNRLGRVEWVNPAYRRMLDPVGKDHPPEVAVSLVAKEKFMLQWPAFSCRVRVVNYYHCKESSTTERKTVQTTVPCDVWKMDFGGFAWRLDLEAALSLGRSNSFTQFTNILNHYQVN